MFTFGCILPLRPYVAHQALPLGHVSDSSVRERHAVHGSPGCATVGFKGRFGRLMSRLAADGIEARTCTARAKRGMSRRGTR